MARYSSYARRRRNRIWSYTLIVLLIAVTLAAYKLKTKKSKLKTKEAPAAQPTEELVPPSAPDTKTETALPLVPPQSPLEPNSEASGLIEDAVACINAETPKVIEARVKLNQALLMPLSDRQQKFVKQQLSALADKWLFSRRIFLQDELCNSYKVDPGARLSDIGAKHKVPHEILKKINKIPNAKSLRAGDVIKVINGPFHARIYRSKFTLDLYLQKTFVRSFKVGLGKPGSETPTGLWRVKPGGKMEKPSWYDIETGKTFEPEDPDYPLGSRWIGLEGIKDDAKDRKGFALHGTKDPNQIGTAGSRGCIRLHNGDAILLYNLLVPVHSKVEVVE